MGRHVVPVLLVLAGCGRFGFQPVPADGGSDGNGSGSADARACPAPSIVTVGPAPKGAAIGDIDGDGNADLVVTSKGSSTLGILPGRGDATFGPRQDLATALDPWGVIVRDLDRDGAQDVVVTGSMVTVFLNRGGLGAPVYYAGPALEHELDTGDFNGDGALDLAITEGTNNSLSVYLGAGDGTFGGATAYQLGANPRTPHVADFDRDGALDVVSCDNGSGTVGFSRGTGTGTFQAEVSFGICGAAVDAADLDHDGLLDLAAVGSATTGNLAYTYRGKGDGSFTAGPTA
ncbi:MAG TPA: VCBS repeat-containing protein, partial [Kofleriaceae bacterium]|nr:VCBS repeat-containing protein [Kofleriaceae bacterium]